MRFRRAFLITSLGAGAFLAGCAEENPEAEPAPPEYVGADACAGCHAAETAAWTGSHHDLAMQPATEETVLGDFDDAELTFAGVTSRFFRRDGAFVVRTDGPDGELADFEVAYTFGVFPLQQYLVPFPGGRYQALSLAWDSRPADEGGRRWFHLLPDDTPSAGDELHWTGRTMNWNYMCAECHSTELMKGYDRSSDSYATTWSDIDVSCEACHGPASRHVELAGTWSGSGGPGEGGATGLADPMADPGGTWTFDPGASIARRTSALPGHAQVETCAHCHSRRYTIAEGRLPGEPLLDSDVVSRLDPVLYHADGQIRDEVYVYGSFVQSRMYAAGVRCSDCHEPHSLRLKAPGNAMCASCHLPSTFDTPEHHFHPTGSTGAQCVECHMPATTYMVVDPRRDHSMRIPRPHLSAEIGTPNACTGCHEGETVAWAVAAVERWYGAPDSTDEARMRAARAIHTGREGLPGAADLLREVAADGREPGIVRATALSLTAAYPTAATLDALQQAADDPDPLVRLGALAGVGGLPPDARPQVAFRLLRDPLRAVRVQAARVLASFSPQSPSQRALLAEVSDEFVKAQEVNADHPTARAALGTFYAERGRVADAEREYRSAIALDSAFVPAYVNLADLYRALSRDADGEQLLERALAHAPEDPGLLHARGLQLVRFGRVDEAMTYLRDAARLAPESPRYAYVLAVALNSGGDGGGALATVRTALGAHPYDRELLSLAVSLHRDRGELGDARGYAERLLELTPDDPGLTELLRSLGA